MLKPLTSQQEENDNQVSVPYPDGQHSELLWLQLVLGYEKKISVKAEDRHIKYPINLHIFFQSGMLNRYCDMQFAYSRQLTLLEKREIDIYFTLPLFFID